MSPPEVAINDHRLTSQLFSAAVRAIIEDVRSNMTAALTTGLLRGLVANKKVTVKVGMIGEKPPGEDEFVIGFDPQTPLRLTPNRLLLPFVATASAFPPDVPFYFSRRGTCSSMNRHRGLTNQSWYNQKALAACQHVAATLPRSGWYLHDEKARNFADLSKVHGGCFFCQDAKIVWNRDGLPTLPALALVDLLQAIASPIALLDLDAQGSDVALIESVRVALPWVRRVKLECQEPQVGAGFMYRSEVPNRCSRAEQFLRSAGFELEERRLNNCGCEEYNLFMVRTRK